MAGGGTGWRGRLRQLLGVMTVAAMVGATAVGCGSDDNAGDGGPVTLEFAQWWAPELPAGSFDKLMADFTAQNPLTPDALKGVNGEPR